MVSITVSAIKPTGRSTLLKPGPRANPPTGIPTKGAKAAVVFSTR
jgi:hypothetical protein